MARLLACFLALPLLLAATPAKACTPPAIPFVAGSTRLSAEDLREIRRLAGEFRQMRPGTTLRLDVEADRTGALQARRWVARRRGDVVKAALVRRGVPAAAITVEWDPLRPGGTDGLSLVWVNTVEGPSGCW
jgi:hypothetical protein